MNFSSPRAAVWEKKMLWAVLLDFPSSSPGLKYSKKKKQINFVFLRNKISWDSRSWSKDIIKKKKKRFVFLSKKYRETVDHSTFLLCSRWLLVLGWWMRPTLSKVRRHVIGVSIIYLGVVISWSCYWQWRDWLRDSSCGYFVTCYVIGDVSMTS